MYSVSRMVSCVASVFLLLVVASATYAAVRTVDNLSGGDTNLRACTSAANDCSLRGAIQGAASGDTINFDSTIFSVPRTINTTSVITFNQTVHPFGPLALSITGPGSNLLTIASTTSIFSPSGGNNLISGLTLMSNGTGTAINVQEPDVQGSTGTFIDLTIRECVFNGTGFGLYFLFNNNSDLVVENTEIYNTVGAVNITALGSANFSDVYIHDSAYLGYFRTGATFTRARIERVIRGGTAEVVGNTPLAFRDSILTENGNPSQPTSRWLESTLGVTSFENSTISGNYSAIGGGNRLFNNTSVRLTNSTVSNNAFTPFTQTNLTLVNSIIGDNSGMRDYTGSVLGSVSFNSLVSRTDSTQQPTAGWGTGQNGNIVGTETTPISPQLIPLTNNGGPTKTHALNLNSRGLRAGRSPNSFVNDQRGYPRPTTGADMGSYQSTIVTNDAGSGPGSFREATANSISGGTIQFDPVFFSQPRTIIGNYGSDKNLTIVGPGANLLTLDADNFGRVFTTGNGATVNLSNVRLTRGRAFFPDSAGGVLIAGNSTLNATNIRVDSSNAYGFGGGIYADGTLNLSDSIVENNSAGTSAGIQILSGRTATITRSIVRGNTSTGSTGNSGGIGNSGTLNFYDSTLSGNTAWLGGGMANGGFANCANSTISGNRAFGDKGAGIYNGDRALIHLLNTTISQNQADTTAGAGIWNDNFASSPITLRARNSIIAGNISGAGNPRDYVGSITDLGNNIINNPNPGLAPLGDYGGPTPTHALLATSPGINMGNNCVLTEGCGINHASYLYDQRGQGTPRLIGGNVDIGSFERNITFDQTSLPNGNPGFPYNQTISTARLSNFGGHASNALMPPFNFSVVSGSLPPGLLLSPSGVLSGTPTAFGLSTFVIKAVDADGIGGAQQYTISIVGPTAAGVSVAGRILSPTGQGLNNASIYITDMSGVQRTTRSSAFGYYRFDDIVAGETYVISVISKRYIYSARTVSVFDEITNLDLMPDDE